MIIKRLAFFCLAAIFLVACKTNKSGAALSDNSSAAAVSSSSHFDYGDALSSSEIAEPINLIPAISSDSASHSVAKYIYNGLVKYDKDLQLVGDLAKSWEISPDNLSITFYLRQGVKWHDGKPFTADDVLFTYEFMIDDNTPTSYDADYKKIKKFEVIDNYTVKVTYDEIYAPALGSFGIWIMPAHLLRGQQVGKSILQRKPVGTGAYILEDWSAGKSLTLKAFEDYFEGRAKLDKIMIRVIPDQSTQFMELLNGSIDIMRLNPTQATKQTANERYKKQYETYSYLDDAYTYVGYNLKKPPFDDKTLRQALSYAVPKDEIISGIIFGQGVAATGPYKPETFWYNPNVKKYDYDLEKASQMLAEAGYKKNKDGILEKNGKPLKFDIITNQGNVARSQVAEVLQRSWAELGIKSEVRVLEWATFLNEYVNKGNFSVVVLAWNIVVDPDLFDIWHSSRCGGNGLNFVCFNNKEVDELLLKGQSSYDPNVRKIYYDKIQEILAEEAPYTFLYVPNANFALSKRFKGIKPAPAGIGYNFIDWYVPKNDQKYKFEK